MTKPAHGEPGHECPGDIIVEWRPKARTLLDYQHGLKLVLGQLQAVHIMSQLTGDREAQAEFEQIHAEIAEEYQEIDAWYEKFILEHVIDAEELKRQEHNVPNSRPDGSTTDYTEGP